MDSAYSPTKAPCKLPPCTSPPSSFTPLHALCSNHMVFCLFSERTKLRIFALAVSSAWKTLPPVFIWLTPTYLSHPIKVHLLSGRGLLYWLLTLKDAPPNSLHFWHFLTHHAFIVFTSLCLQVFYLFVGLFYSCSSPLLLSLSTSTIFQLSRDQIGFICGCSLWHQSSAKYITGTS